MFRRFDARWVMLHLAPAVLLTAGMAALSSAVSPDALGAFILLLGIAIVSYGEARMLSDDGVATLRSTLKAGCTYAAALVLALVLMSAIDIAGHDRTATLAAMGAAGFLIGLVQVRMWHLPASWVAASVAGWLLGAVVFRMTAGALPDLHIGPARPFAVIRSAGHNELLWSCLGLAGYGLLTSFKQSPISHRPIHAPTRGR